MFHIVQEGCPTKVGLNLGWGNSWRKPWFRLIWTWVNLPENKAVSYRFRFRPFMWPWFIFSKNSWDTFEEELYNRNSILLSREAFEDLVGAESFGNHFYVW